MKKPDLSRLKEILDYDPSTGKVYTKKGRQLTPDQDGLVVVFDSKANIRSVKHKLEKVISKDIENWITDHEVIPQDREKQRSELQRLVDAAVKHAQQITS